MDLKKWLQIMETYEGGRSRLPLHHAHRRPRAPARGHDETEVYGFEKVRQEQITLGLEVRARWPATATRAWRPKVSRLPAWWSSYTTDPEIQSSKKFLALGLQTAAGSTPTVRRAGRLPRPSAWAFSAWRSGTTSRAPCSNSIRP